MTVKTKYLFAITVLAFSGCFEGPSSSPNSTIDGDLAGKWMLKIENLSSAFDHHYRINFTTDGHFEKFDSTCFVGPSVSDSACTISYYWHGKYSREGSGLLLIRKSDSLEILPSNNKISDTMKYNIERLDNEALVIDGKINAKTGDSGTYTESFWRIK